MFYAQPVCSKYFDISFFCLYGECMQAMPAKKGGAALCRVYRARWLTFCIAGTNLSDMRTYKLSLEQKTPLNFICYSTKNCTTKMATRVYSDCWLLLLFFVAMEYALTIWAADLLLVLRLSLSTTNTFSFCSILSQLAYFRIVVGYTAVLFKRIFCVCALVCGLWRH